MYIKCLVENKSTCELNAKHGVCFYIKTKNHEILFDLGPDKLFLENAQKCGIDITNIDTVIISHGHNDHGGGLKTFLSVNNKAKIYIQREAFSNHYTKFLFFFLNISLDKSLINNENIICLDGDYVIDEELSLITSKKKDDLSPMNDHLYDYKKEKDMFNHEQSLLIKENKNVLFTGCSHSGVTNILDSINGVIDVQIGGFHLYNPVNKKHVDDDYLKKIENKFKLYNNEFYTCHCTGEYCYDYLSKNNPNIHYISCGMELNI